MAPAEKHRKSKKHESNISVNGSDDQISPASERARENCNWIRSSVSFVEIVTISGRFSTGTGLFYGSFGRKFMEYCLGNHRHGLFPDIYFPMADCLLTESSLKDSNYFHRILIKFDSFSTKSINRITRFGYGYYRNRTNYYLTSIKK